MTVPPGPGPFGSTPPSGGGAQPWGQQSPGQPAGPWPPAPPQWPAGPTPPTNGGDRGKWILIGLALVAVIAVSVAATVLGLRRDSDTAATPSAPHGDTQFASANDTGPANLITEDPTCDAWRRVAREHYDKTESAKWTDRDANIPASAWTSEQRNMYDTVGKSMETAVGQAKQLARKTPHRVMRELYGQFAAYGTAFIDKIPTYTAEDNKVAVVVGALTTGPADICSAIKYGSVQTVAPLVDEPSPPSQTAPMDTAETPQQFLAAGNDVCTEWAAESTKSAADTAQWRDIDPNIPATDWTPEQKAINDSVAPRFTANADARERLGRESGNPILEDFAVLGAQYQRAFVSALPNYTPADSYLAESATLLGLVVNFACKAAH